MSYKNLSEEAIKNEIRNKYFSKYSVSGDFEKIDFTVKQLHQNDLFEEYEIEYLLWAETKKSPHDLDDLFTQLVLTIGSYRITEKALPPKYLGAFDNEKIAFVEYTFALPIFNLNDFNWNVTPSNTNTKEFEKAKKAVTKYLTKKERIFYYDKDDKELTKFIKENFVLNSQKTGRIQITKNNFVNVYYKWCDTVKPTIQADWQKAKKNLILDSDFYLADLFVDETQGQTIQDSLKVILKEKEYIYGSFVDEMGFKNEKKVSFTDEQKAYNQFWNKYERPPKKQFWDYILSRRDLLVPQDIRERKGAFFTPPQWSDLSKKYLADYLGENWQDEYYIWDCCCGTGNLEIGLTNKKNIFASTLDSADVDIIKQLIKDQTVKNLFDDHVFQFDFLNDNFIAQKDGGKLPDKLAEIINDKEKRKKLVIYINPPYAEAGNSKTITHSENHKSGVSIDNKTYKNYRDILGKASNELFAQFFIRIQQELNGCKLGTFSTLKYLNSTNFIKFRQFFKAEFINGFMVLAKTFDNVAGNFPISFIIWNIEKQYSFSNGTLDVLSDDNNLPKTKRFNNKIDTAKSLNKWIKKFCFENSTNNIGVMGIQSPDFQQNVYLCIENTSRPTHITYASIKSNNLISFVIYFAVRKCIEHTWLNHNDQFFYPNDGYKTDKEFQSDCLMFTLFHSKNRISCIEQNKNNWLPFTETELGINQELASTFMQDFIAGKSKIEKSENTPELFEVDNNTFLIPTEPIQFSKEALEVRSAALEVFKYYHKVKPFEFIPYNINTSLYDIKKAFKGTNKQGKMNNYSNNEHFNDLMAVLQNNIKLLAKKIEPKIYEYGFLI